MSWVLHAIQPLGLHFSLMFSQAQTASQKLFWHNSVWIWQPIWKWLSESPHPKCNYHCICCEAVCDECFCHSCAGIEVVASPSYPQAVAFQCNSAGHHTQAVRSRHASTCSKCWSLAKAGTQGPVAVSITTSPLQDRKRTGARQFVIVSVLGTCQEDFQLSIQLQTYHEHFANCKFSTLTCERICFLFFFPHIVHYFLNKYMYVEQIFRTINLGFTLISTILYFPLRNIWPLRLSTA